MLAQAQDAAAVRERFEGLMATPEGSFCLIDYVNFKGEGTNSKERYHGQGWGLLQVLEGMPASKTLNLYPLRFAESAKRVLSQRGERTSRTWGGALAGRLAQPLRSLQTSAVKQDVTSRGHAL